MLPTRARIPQPDEKSASQRRIVSPRNAEYGPDVFHIPEVAGLSQRQNAILRMQQTHGNAAVMRMLASARPAATVQRCGGKPCNCSDEEKAAHMMAAAAHADSSALPVARKQEDGEALRRLAIASLAESPVHLRRRCSVISGWEYEFDGCSLPPAAARIAGDKDNPAGGADTQFANPARTGACDNHDRCYQTCGGTGGGGRAGCDQGMLNDMLATCNSSSEGTWRKMQCRKWARIYYAGLRVGGGSAWAERQKQVCPCTPANDVVPGPSDVASNDQQADDTETG